MTKRKWMILILLMSMVYSLWSTEAECGIVLRVLVVNPSETRTQEAVLKAYLPKEAKPEDILDLGDLKIDYDIEKDLYYVYKKFELEPGETASRSIEIKDIWIISESELKALTTQAKKLVEKLKETEYFDSALTLQKDIEEKAAKILDKQAEAMDVVPQTHIAVYRENVNTLDTVKSVLARLENMLIETRVAKVATGPAAKRVSVKATWWVILGVIIALGLLSLIFFIIWQRQAAIAVAKQREKETEEK